MDLLPPPKKSGGGRERTSKEGRKGMVRRELGKAGVRVGKGKHDSKMKGVFDVVEGGWQIKKEDNEVLVLKNS